MTAPDANALVYAGVGAHTTPQNVLDDMTTMSGWLARTGWHLSSGGSDGASGAFLQGAPVDQRTIYLPWTHFNELKGPDCIVPKPADLAACMKVVERINPADWGQYGDSAKTLHAHSVAMVLGPELDRPVKAVVCWQPPGTSGGPAGMVIRVAERHDIPVLNLATVTPREACEELLAIRNQHEAQSRTLHADADTPDPRPITSATLTDTQQLGYEWTVVKGRADALNAQPLHLPEYADLVDRAERLHSAEPIDDPEYEPHPALTEILEYSQYSKTALDELKQFSEAAEQSLNELAKLRKEMPSYNLALHELEDHIWLEPALELQSRGENFLRWNSQLDHQAHLDADPQLWQRLNGTHSALAAACAEAMNRAIPDLTHHDLYLPPLPPSLAASEEELTVHTAYRALRHQWHAFILRAQNADSYAFDYKKEFDYPDCKELIGQIKTMTNNPQLPHNITEHLRTISDKHVDYQRTQNDIHSFTQSAEQALQTYRTFVDTINDPSTSATHFDDVDGYYDWQEAAERLADKGENIALYEREDTEREHFFKINPDVAKRTLETTEKLRDAAWDKQFNTPRQEIAAQRAANEQETPQRSIKM